MFNFFFYAGMALTMFFACLCSKTMLKTDFQLLVMTIAMIIRDARRKLKMKRRWKEHR